MNDSAKRWTAQMKKMLGYDEIYNEGDDNRLIMPFADYVTLFNNTVVLQVDTYR